MLPGDKCPLGIRIHHAKYKQSGDRKVGRISECGLDDYFGLHCTKTMVEILCNHMSNSRLNLFVQ